MKILLLNPPGKKIYLRQYYCSQTSKANYYFQPTDLVILSGILSKEHDIKVLDCIAEQYSIETAKNKIKTLNPDVIISLTGAVSWGEDIDFLEQISKDSMIIATGDLLLEKSKEKLIQHPFIKAIIRDFTSEEILDFLKEDYSNLETIDYRSNGKIIQSKKKNHKKEFIIPTPLHELFLSNKYRHVFIKKKPFATVLTDYGCPFDCSFCIMSTLRYKARPLPNILNELEYLKNLKVKEIFFLDQTFGLNKLKTKKLLQAMIIKNLKFSWFCFSRVDVLDKELISLMKQAGCHTIMFGVESANNNILSKHKKGYTKEQIKNTFKIVKSYGIKTLGTFLIGLPEDTEESIKETISFAKELKCDFASFNVAVPRVNTELRKEAIEEKLIAKDFEIMDQSGASSIAMPTKTLSIDKVNSLRNYAIRSFYLSPSYIFKRLTSIHSFTEFKTQIGEAFALIENLISKEDGRK